MQGVLLQSAGFLAARRYLAGGAPRRQCLTSAEMGKGQRGSARVNQPLRRQWQNGYQAPGQEVAAGWRVGPETANQTRAWRCGEGGQVRAIPISGNRPSPRHTESTKSTRNGSQSGIVYNNYLFSCASRCNGIIVARVGPRNRFPRSLECAQWHYSIVYSSMVWDLHEAL